MIELSKTIQNWKNGLVRKGLAPDTIEELESHLCESLEALRAKGMSDSDAFSIALNQLGPEDDLVSEFGKISRILISDWVALCIAGIFGIAAVGGILSLLWERGMVPGSPLLTLHVGTITVAFVGLLFLAMLGAYTVLRRCFTKRGESAFNSTLFRIFRWSTVTGLALIFAAIVTGCFWSRTAHGVYWSWDIKEIGSMVVLLWYGAAAAIAWFKSVRPSLFPAYLITAGLVTHFSWFVLSGMATTTISVMIAIVFGALILSAFLLFRESDGTEVLT